MNDIHGKFRKCNQLKIDETEDNYDLAVEHGGYHPVNLVWLHDPVAYYRNYKNNGMVLTKF